MSKPQAPNSSGTFQSKGPNTLTLPCVHTMAHRRNQTKMLKNTENILPKKRAIPTPSVCTSSRLVIYQTVLLKPLLTPYLRVPALLPHTLCEQIPRLHHFSPLPFSCSLVFHLPLPPPTTRKILCFPLLSLTSSPHASTSLRPSYL